ncbi:MAG: hypothetical protein OHK0039_08480 [Bacteroidia bacterium]
MIRTSHLLIPAFLRQIDRRWLLHRPALWATRVHYLLCYGSLATLLVLVQGSLLRSTPSHVPHPWLHLGLAFVPAVLLFLLWAYQMSLFRIGHAGIRSPFVFRDQSIYALGVLLALALPLLYGHMVHDKVQNTVPRHMLIDDVNALNIGEWYVRYANPGLDATYYEEAFSFSIDQRPFDHHQVLGYEQCRSIVERTHEHHAHLNYIEAYRQAFEKYSGRPFSLSAEDLLANYYLRGTYEHTSHVAAAKARIARNLRLIDQAQTRAFGAARSEARYTLFFFATLLWLALQTFLKTGWRAFAGVLLLGAGWAAGCTLLTLLFQLGANSYSKVSPQLIFVGSVLAGYIFFGALAYSSANGRHIRMWKLLSVGVVSLTTPLLPLLLMQAYDVLPSDMTYGALICGIVLAVVVWNVALRQRFDELLALPKDN